MNKRPRVRELGLKIGHLPTGKYNAITDVPGVKVGHVTLIEGAGKLQPGKGPVRTGVTAILPHGGNLFEEKVKAATHVINGFGKSIGLVQINELGTIETPILLTNTLNVGIVADALVAYMCEQNPGIGIITGTVNPVVCECNDGYLNDIQGRHVRPEHVRQALQNATDGPVEEGAVGGGTGMTMFGFKGGIGTSSRLLTFDGVTYTVGVLVMSNFAKREELLIDGVPVGRILRDWKDEGSNGDGSIIIVVGTDLPVSERQLGRLARRAAFGLARTGSLCDNGSGDIVIAFCTDQRLPHTPTAAVMPTRMLVEDGYAVSKAFQAVIEATEEAILNALFKAETVEGRDGHRVAAIPIDETVEILKKYHRIV